MKFKKALITGISGQDGYYLSNFLLEKGYDVHGLCRRKATNTHGHITNTNIKIHIGDLTDASGIAKLLEELQPDEIYHLGAQTFVKESFENPQHTVDVNLGGTLNILSGIRMHCPSAKLYNAGTSEMFGNAKMQNFHTSGSATTSNMGIYQAYDESCRFEPASPYGIAKLAAHNMCGVFRDSYNLFICNGILFNHESPKRGKEFVTRKIVIGLANYFKSLELGKTPKKLVLGNTQAIRDWGYSGDFVEAMWLMLQQGSPDDYVICTGNSYSVQDFLEMTLEVLNEKFKIKGINIEDISEVAITSDEHKRPSEVHTLRGNPRKAKNKLGWTSKTSIQQLIEMMVNSEL